MFFFRRKKNHKTCSDLDNVFKQAECGKCDFAKLSHLFTFPNHIAHVQLQTVIMCPTFVLFSFSNFNFTIKTKQIHGMTNFSGFVSDKLYNDDVVQTDENRMEWNEMNDDVLLE